MLFNLGVVGALVLVIFLIYTSIYQLCVLCPWCMVDLGRHDPDVLAVTLYNLKTGNIPVPASVRRLFCALYGWVPLITLACYIVVAVIAQVQLDWLHTSSSDARVVAGHDEGRADALAQPAPRVPGSDGAGVLRTRARAPVPPTRASRCRAPGSAAP